MFARVLVANRGEIAVRVMRTLRRLGIESVAVYSDADAGAPHMLAADVAVRLGPAPASRSYLDIERVIAAARQAGAEAIHPGYGFLSERPALPDACAAAGIAFVGPGAEAMALLGDKVAAKTVAERAGVPIVPGLHRATLSDDEIREWAGDQELPLMLKAAAGGGGRGMRIVRALGELPEALGAARREAMGAFGDDRLLVERYIDRPRHIEVQVIADAHGTVLHLGERECSLQRRHQKVIEEAPSPVVDAQLRARMGAAAVALTSSAGYVNAGTVELIAARDDPSSFYFLEMNARLQVEHPVTEAVCGLDLVELQLRVAAGEPLALAQDDVRLDGHAVEVRIYAEDPATGFLPSTGRIAGYREPRGVRVDSGVAAGSVVGSDYDPMLAKVIAHAPDRATALSRLDLALGEMVVAGPTTNTAWLRALLRRPEVREGELDTGLIERLGDEVAPPALADDLPGVALAALTGPPPGDDPWDARDGWRPGGARAAAHALLDGPDGPVRAELAPDAADRIAPAGSGALLVTGAGGVSRTVDVFGDDDGVWLVDGGVPTHWALAPDSAAQHHGTGSLEAPMPGVVLDVRAEVGATVQAGDVLVVLESMKMELSVVAPAEGTVAELHVQKGDPVIRGQVMAVVQ
jgi:acetyl-CoA/propionyl-CoA carboxylase biotin carboxyl carrier protein